MAARDDAHRRLRQAADARADKVHAGTKVLIDRLAAAAFDRMWRTMIEHPEISPRDAIREAQAEFGGRFAGQMAQAFSGLLQRAVGVAEVRAMPVGGLSLSKRLYRHNTETTARALQVVKDHAKGVHQARELALQLYDGYKPADAPRNPLEGAARAKLPKALRELAADPGSRKGLAQVIAGGRAQAARLKSAPLRAAYTEALDAWEAGAARGTLQRKLRVAQEEKNRFFAQRIAQTELARAHQAQVAAELMADPELDVVQVVLNPAHPKADICNLHARADLWGLGPGRYPKAKAPRPPFHPFCWCKLKPRYSATADGAARVPGAEAAYLRSLPVEQAAAVMGSRERLQHVLGGASAESVINAGKDPLYRLARLGDGGGHALVAGRNGGAAESKPLVDPYEIAKAGGKHRGFLRQVSDWGPRQRAKAIASLWAEVTLHLDKISSPQKYVPSWAVLSESHRSSLLRDWRKEVTDHQEQIAILKGYEDEHR